MVKITPEIVLILGFLVGTSVTVPYFINQTSSPFSANVLVSFHQTYAKTLLLASGDAVDGSFSQSSSVSMRYVVMKASGTIILNVSKTSATIPFNFTASSAGNYTFAASNLQNSTTVIIGLNLVIYHKPLLQYNQFLTPAAVLLPSALTGFYYDAVARRGKPNYSSYSLLSLASQFLFLFFEIAVQVLNVPSVASLQLTMLGWILTSLFVTLVAGSIAGSRITKSIVWMGGILWIVLNSILLTASLVNSPGSLDTTRLVEGIATILILVFVVFSSSVEAMKTYGGKSRRRK